MVGRRGERGVADIMHGRSRMTVDPRILTMLGWGTSGFHRPGRHCLHQARGGERKLPRVKVQSGIGYTRDWATRDRKVFPGDPPIHFITDKMGNRKLHGTIRKSQSTSQKRPGTKDKAENERTNAKQQLTNKTPE